MINSHHLVNAWSRRIHNYYILLHAQQPHTINSTCFYTTSTYICNFSSSLSFALVHFLSLSHDKKKKKKEKKKKS
jgi:hypothetical protein